MKTKKAASETATPFNPANIANFPASDKKKGDNLGIDFSFVEKPKANPEIGLFTIKDANQWIDEASNRPMPQKLLGQLWFQNEICILFSDTNLGKSILAVQIADAISSGSSVMGLENEAGPQQVLYVDFELSDKQFATRYTGEDRLPHKFSPDLKRIEINPDGYTDGDLEESVKDSLERLVEETGAKVMILDNITYLSRETEKAKDALPLMKWLKAFGRRYGLSILVLAHTPKRNLQEPITKNDLGGSKMLINFTDGCFAIGESNNGSSMRYIKEIKQRNLSLMYHANNVIVCKIDKVDNFLQFVFVGYGCESEHLRKLSNDNRSNLSQKAKELHDKGKSQREIANELGIGLGTVNKYLNK